MRRRRTILLVSVGGIATLLGLAIAGPDAATRWTGFAADEVHTTFPYAPPGFRDVPDHRQVFDGDRAAFERLVAGLEAPNRTTRNREPGIVAEDLIRTDAAFRALSLAIAPAFQDAREEAALTPEQVRGALAAFPGWVGPVLEACEAERCPIRALVESSRFLRLTRESLRRMDLDADGVVTRGEFLGAPRSRIHLLGTDGLGRDAFVRLLQGLRVSALVGVAAAATASLLGVAYGAVSGMAGRIVSTAMMRFVDVLYGLPFLFFVILLISVAGPSLLNLLLAIVCVQWLGMARTVHSLVSSLRRAPFVEAARLLGCGPVRACVTHILPNARGPILAWSALLVPASIKEEAFLSFLGLGIQAPEASLGTLIAEGAQRIAEVPWLVAAPAVLLFGFVFLIHLACDEWDRAP